MLPSSFYQIIIHVGVITNFIPGQKFVCCQDTDGEHAAGGHRIWKAGWKVHLQPKAKKTLQILPSFRGNREEA